MGGPVFGFGGGREDIFEPEKDVYWGTEEEWVGSAGSQTRIAPDKEMVLENPLAAIQMGLIYVNPEGPGGNADPAQSGPDIRATFARMAMNAEKPLALTAAGQHFGPCQAAGRGAPGGP